MEFTDISKNKCDNVFFRKSNNKYKNITEGINIFGICKVKKCENFEKEIILPLKSVYKIDLVKERNELICPECENFFIPKKIGFHSCEYKIKGTKIENQTKIDFELNGKSYNKNIIQCFGSENSGEILMLKLLIEITIIYE